MIIVARIVATAAVTGLPITFGLNDLLVSGCFAVVGVVAHAQALRSVAGRPARKSSVAAQALLLALLFAIVASQTTGVANRVHLIDAMFTFGAGVTLWILRPLLRFWGARLIAVVLALAVIAQACRVVVWLVSLDGEIPSFALPSLNASARATVDVVIALVVTGGFLLLNQERLRQRIEQLMVIDALTGALNRRGIMPRLERAWAQTQENSRSLSVVMLDLDHFKRINDQHGHARGDKVLETFATHVTARLRESDQLCRWGGEEFLLLLPDTELAGAYALAESLRESVAETPMDGEALRVTVSAGVACSRELGRSEPGTHTCDLTALLRAADHRLYRAKMQRNFVVAE